VSKPVRVSSPPSRPYVDQVVLPQYAFVTMPPVVMKIGQILFVGDEYPESANDSSLWGHHV